MKFIHIPVPQPVYNLQDERMKDDDGNDASISFRDFVIGRLGDPKFASDMASVLSAVEIKTQLDCSNGVMMLDTADWERLLAVTKTPSPQTMYHPQVSRALVPFMLAITDAQSKAPPAVGQDDDPAEGEQ